MELFQYSTRKRVNYPAKKRDDMFISETKVQVRYSETDQMGVVYHANYLIWFELGRTQLVHDLGFDYAQMEKEGFISPVLDVQAAFRKPVRYGGFATIRTWIETYNGLKTTYGYEVVDEEGNVCVTGTTSNIVVRRDNFRPISMKKVFPSWHEVYDRNKRGSGEE